MKKILSVTSFLLCVVMLFSLFSCAADGDSAQSESQSDTSAYTDRASETLDKSTDKPKPNSEEMLLIMAMEPVACHCPTIMSGLWPCSSKVGNAL